MHPEKLRLRRHNGYILSISFCRVVGKRARVPLQSSRSKYAKVFEGLNSLVRADGVEGFTAPLLSRVILGKLFNLSELQFLYQQNSNNTSQVERIKSGNVSKVISPYNALLYITIIFTQVTENHCIGTVKSPSSGRRERRDGAS